jgi:hypothetical protein
MCHASDRRTVPRQTAFGARGHGGAPHHRPVKEALFNIIQFRYRGRKVLDLFRRHRPAGYRGAVPRRGGVCILWIPHGFAQAGAGESAPLLSHRRVCRPIPRLPRGGRGLNLILLDPSLRLRSADAGHGHPSKRLTSFQRVVYMVCESRKGDGFAPDLGRIVSVRPNISVWKDQADRHNEGI